MGACVDTHPSEPGTEPPGAPHRSRALAHGLTLVQTAGLALLSYVCLFHLSVVRGSSMAPSIHDGDRILIDPVSYLFGEVQRGDIVVLQYPLDPSVDYIKRVVGLPGDEIEIEHGEVWVNGRPLEEPYVLGPDPATTLQVEVLPAHYFVLGDNRARSCDSREFGQVPVGYVRGKVELRVWPPTRAGRIGD
jgi:signal peptidase I